MRLAGLEDDNFDFYLDALMHSKKGYQIIPARDIDEIFVNSYNPEWAANWDGNTDLQVTLDLYAIITYITQKMTLGQFKLSMML